ncbi:MAG TPA: hypothetical protein VL993_02675 [Stellaceae bacterium]|nr:hypothetical protein [Stellaceae bacterium]
MKQVAKNAVKRAIDFAMPSFSMAVSSALLNERQSQSQQLQRGIVNQYLMCKSAGITPYPAIRDAGFRVYSQFEEDGIILYVLAMIGFKTRRVVEMCCGTGDECMSANLILNHGFDGYLFDGSEENIARADRFFRQRKECLLYPPVITQGWITVENVNDLLTRSGCAGEVDLFSLDIDGNDYWVLEAIEAINPRLIVCETHNVIPPDKSLTIEYQPDFDYRRGDGAAQDYRSASLLAMQRLCKRRGYRMIGGHRHGFNVFFLRSDEGVGLFPEVDINDVQDNHWSRWSRANRWPLVKDMPWKEV